jgi:sugar O-acyltransferase (sialic acid O-acetyltransferase NeuD family)
VRERNDIQWAEVKMPRLGANDEQALLVAWNVATGEKVQLHQPIAVIETSKAAQDLEAEAEGYLYPLVQAGVQVRVQETIAIVVPRQDASVVERYQSQLAKAREKPPSPSTAVPPGVRLTKKAMDFALQTGIDLATLPKGRILREKDITPFILSAGTPGPSDKSATPTSEPPILIVGGGGLGKMCIEIIRSMGGYTIAGIVDANFPVGHDVLGVQVIGSDQEASIWRKQGVMFGCNAVGAVTVPSPREAVYKRLKKTGFLLPNLIHPTAEVSPSAHLGDGCIIEANAVIGPAAHIGNDSIINTSAVVSHDCHLGDHVHVAPGAIVAGDVTIGNRTVIGIGVTIHMGVTIGSDVLVYNGQNVFTDIPSGKTVR